MIKPRPRLDMDAGVGNIIEVQVRAVDTAILVRLRVGRRS